MPEPDAVPRLQVPDDLVALFRAEGDQMRAAAEQFANVLATFHRTLVSGGVSQPTADALTMSYWGLLMRATEALGNG